MFQGGRLFVISSDRREQLAFALGSAVGSNSPATIISLQNVYAGDVVWFTKVLISEERRNFMPLITDREMEDFEAAILGAGFEVDDFNVVPLEDDEPTGVDQYTITGTVTIQRISTDDFITYTVGFDSIWPQQFEADLQAGKFGQP